MNILVTGGAGYLGSVLIPKLLVRGHQVTVVDLGYFGMGHLRNMTPEVKVIREDLRRLLTEPQHADVLLAGIDCVIHLAAVSNDPSAELQPELTHETNFSTTVALARAAKERGIRFLFSSSCSIYGEADGLVDENGRTNPLTVYAISKVQAEEQITALADDRWRPVILRNGTLYGYSPRMRFDLVVNIFSLGAILHNEIIVFGEGLQWRPFLHISDCARAFVFFAEKKDAQHICYNIAHQNLRVTDLARLFSELRPGLTVTYRPTQDVDTRDYSVSTARMAAEGFAPSVDVRMGAENIMDVLAAGLIPDPESVFYRNAKWLKELTQIASSDHRHIVGLLESFTTISATRRL